MSHPLGRLSSEPYQQHSLDQDALFSSCSPMTDEEDLVAEIRFALRQLDPWPPKSGAVPSEDYARKVVSQLKLSGWRFRRPAPKKGYSTP